MATAQIERDSVTTQDVDAARERVAAVFCPHGLEPRGAVDVRLRAARADQVGIIHLDYGGVVEISPEPLGDFYLVQIPRAGAARVAHAGQEVRSDRTRASVLSPHEPTSMTWFVGNPQTIVYLTRSLVEHALESLTGVAASGPLTFDVGMPLTTPRARSWLSTVECLRAELEDAQGSGLVEHADALGLSIATQLLESQGHSHSRELLRRGASARTLRRALDVIDGRLGEPLTVSAVAAEVGVCTRVLQDAFSRELGVPPLAYIRERRLRAARARLIESAPEVTTVTDVALSLGLSHLGRFAGDYRARFGESPSTTLHRC
ncbi:transcriptional regulator [Terrabacter tumescens]|uniref:Transcriptional regulator n=1 Tax=Terrabacter tumescens TaxID=60443 RepID=A0ABQ2I2F3_9MICO|nr:helix-turn-helix domain-containing protein [Terrabacter tumescens]GGM98331.1 transcriptional regulator [Terrabacter tumescens]